MILAGFLFFLPATILSAQAKDVTLESLLKEMVDRSAIAQFPDPAYTCKQASSYDRNSVAPDKPGWFANGDASQFVRDEMNGDRKEWVLIDADGPGAIVRWWITAPHYKVTFRVYLDGEEKPAIEANIGDLVGGKFLTGAPLSEETARGRNLYLPIPYAKHVKVTVDDMPTQQNLYYQINYRTYEKGTNVETFSMDKLKKQEQLIDQVQKELLASSEFKFTNSESATWKIPAGKTIRLFSSSNSPQCVMETTLKVSADDVTQALRSTLIRIKFDGKETVCCPIGDFFGSGVGVNPYKSWYTSVKKDGTMISRWVMPFKSNMEVVFENLSDKPVEIEYNHKMQPYSWNDHTMYFHCNWRQEREIKTVAGDGTKDFNYIEIKGKGIYCGDSLSVLNRHTGWWGEGDEKIYVDGEKFPSHFGTGSEDYYGYAWCTPEFFESPFHAQPRAEGPQNFGHTTNSRYRLLDGIPFTKDFKFDIEVWHWAATKIDYAVTTYWYALGDATTNQPDNVVEEAKAVVTGVTEFIFDLPGYKIVNKPQGVLSIQNMKEWKNGKWHNDEQLWWTGANRGNELVLAVPVEKSGKQEIVIHLTKAVDYGMVQFTFDGKEIGPAIDLYNDGVINSGAISLGTVDVASGEHRLGVKITGKNEKSTGYLFGMDKYEFVPEK